MNVPQHLRELNPEQQAAALATDGPVLILAGAGSGKTRTLVYRIVHLLRKGIDPRRILAVTFTNRAAAEMRERVTRVIGRDARGLTLSTFHSLGARILRDHGEAAGLPKKFSIYATGDQTALVKRVISEEVFVAATAGEENFDAKRVLYQISSWKNQLVGPEEAKREVIEGRVRGSRSDDYAVLAADVYPRYEEALRAAGAVDFDDLLLLPVSLLRARMDVREALWRRWQYLMIDEYQDTNGAQLELARLLAGPHRNLCVVGDDDQSIYAWRGADLRNILDFERQFPGAQVVILEENYRSTQRILDAANAVIAHNSARKQKRMRTGNGLGPKLDYYEFDEGEGRTAEEHEAEMVAREIGVRRFREQLQWSDFAVLYRTNLQARALEEALRSTNLPYRVIGGTSYFDRKEIADAVAYLRAIVNPRRRGRAAPHHQLSHARHRTHHTAAAGGGRARAPASALGHTARRRRRGRSQPRAERGRRRLRHPDGCGPRAARSGRGATRTGNLHRGDSGKLGGELSPLHPPGGSAPAGKPVGQGRGDPHREPPGLRRIRGDLRATRLGLRSSSRRGDPLAAAVAVGVPGAPLARQRG